MNPAPAGQPRQADDDRPRRARGGAGRRPGPDRLRTLPSRRSASPRPRRRPRPRPTTEVSTIIETTSSITTTTETETAEAETVTSPVEAPTDTPDELSARPPRRSRRPPRRAAAGARSAELAGSLRVVARQHRSAWAAMRCGLEASQHAVPGRAGRGAPRPPADRRLRMQQRRHAEPSASWPSHAAWVTNRRARSSTASWGTERRTIALAGSVSERYRVEAIADREQHGLIVAAKARGSRERSARSLKTVPSETSISGRPAISASSPPRSVPARASTGPTKSSSCDQQRRRLAEARGEV